MGRRRLLLGAGVGVTLVVSLLSIPSAAYAECSLVEIASGNCTVDAVITGPEVTLDGAIITPGAPGSDPGTTDPNNAPADPLADCIYLLANRCLKAGPGRTVPVQPITLADIASFRPDPGVDQMEPNGWMIVGLDTNFYSVVDTQVKNGTLLGLPASVRFTPVGWHWTYGDGESASLATGGRTWAAQGIHEFDPTPTSHIYRQPGTYYIDLTIDFSAEYTVAGIPWTPIAGTLPVPANRLVATAGDAKTVLVERECTVNPSGPGC